MRIAVAAVLIVALLAGCSSEPTVTSTAPTDATSATTGDTPGPTSSPTNPLQAGQEADFITPGVWDVRGKVDYMMAWVHNLGPQPANVQWSVTGPGGGPLPEGWNITFDRASALLAPAATKSKNSQGAYTYPDWARAQLTLRVSPFEPAGNHSIELRVGSAVRNATVVVHANRGVVAGMGSHVYVDTVGTFAADGKEFWSGKFDTVVGGQGAVEGVAFGLMGVTAGETVALYAPPPYAYGYDNPPEDSHYEFNGQTPVFTMKMTKWS